MSLHGSFVEDLDARIWRVVGDKIYGTLRGCLGDPLFGRLARETRPPRWHGVADRLSESVAARVSEIYRERKQA